MCSRCYTTVNPTLPWTTHTPQVCDATKEQFEKCESVNRCTNHPDQELPPRLLVGNICPTCSPNTIVRIIDPIILRDITPKSNPRTVKIYTIGPTSEVCNLIDPSRCRNNECLCKKPDLSNESGERERFWFTYTVRVKNSFDHNFSRYLPSDSPPASSNVDPHQSDVESVSDDDDDDNENYNAQPLAQCYKMRKADMFAFAIANPPVTVPGSSDCC